MMECPSPIDGMVWPARPLDDYLGELRAHGYTVVDGLINEAALERSLFVGGCERGGELRCRGERGQQMVLA